MNDCILVFGMPRSGTTWIGKLFDSHPDTLYRHEPDSVKKLSLPLYPEWDMAPQYRRELQEFVAALPRMRSSKMVGKLPLFPKSYQSKAEFNAYWFSAAVAKAVSRLHRGFPCLYRPTAARHEQARVVWKSIESPGRLGVCMEALPRARAIHVMRHPCGYVASLLRGEAGGHFNSPASSAEDLWVHRMLLKTSTGKTHGLRLDDIKQLALEERMAWRWVLTQEKILSDVIHNERVLTVRYEDLCAEPQATTRRMFAFAGLGWNPQSEAFVRASTHTAKRTTDTDYYSVFKPPKASAQRWRSELEPSVIEHILQVLRKSPLYAWYADDTHASSARSEAAA